MFVHGPLGSTCHLLGSLPSELLSPAAFSGPAQTQETGLGDILFQFLCEKQGPPVTTQPRGARGHGRVPKWEWRSQDEQ